MHDLPLIDIAPLRTPGLDAQPVAASLRRALRQDGFFAIVGHGVPAELCQRVEDLSRQFFAWDVERKLELDMHQGGLAWRGYFPLGKELTSGQPDHKEGLYFGQELDAAHPKVRAQTPLHGTNLFPALPGFREAVLSYIAALSDLGQTVMTGIALSLDLPLDYFLRRYTWDPFVLFRIFHYPPLPAHSEDWSVGEHTDYGLLTLLHQDQEGLEIKSGRGWLTVPPVPGAFLCNVGDMLERMTSGNYRSTPHRVRHQGTRPRLSLPFFFDPNFDAEVQRIDPGARVLEDVDQRWDQASVHDFHGSYGAYLCAKVARVFPALARNLELGRS